MTLNFGTSCLYLPCDKEYFIFSPGLYYHARVFVSQASTLPTDLLLSLLQGGGRVFYTPTQDSNTLCS